MWIGREISYDGQVLLGVPRRNEESDTLTQEVLTGEVRHRRQTAVQVDDLAFGVDDRDGAGECLEQLAGRVGGFVQDTHELPPAELRCDGFSVGNGSPLLTALGPEGATPLTPCMDLHYYQDFSMIPRSNSEKTRRLDEE